jgi:quinol-cytochrome oxidoreductase complex cytochrome b subunit
LGISIKVDDENFSPYYTTKDLLGMVGFIAFTSLFIFFAPNVLGHSDNYLPANPLVTPPHIVPEWYFLPFYAILRSIPDKVGGVSIMFFSILTLFFVPYLFKPEVRSLAFRPISRYLYWLFVLDCLVLGWVGGKPIAFPFFEIGQFSTMVYIVYFWIAYPLVIYIEKWFWTNDKYMDSIIDKYLHYEMWFAFWKREKQRPITIRKMQEFYNYRKSKRH